jgi:putative hemolysin
MTDKFSRITFSGMRGFLVLAVIAGSAATATAMLDPAAVYCRSLGYENLRGLTRRGEAALCRLPDDTIVYAYSFFTGRVGLQWSYCAQQGYEARRVVDTDTCKECTACVLPDGSEIDVATLMGLDVRESICGDGSCATAEDFDSCPIDCPSGGADDLCDGVVDARCDPDCVELGENDFDCPAISIDLKPGSCPNPFRLDHRDKKDPGVLPVAILGTEEFDVTRVNPATITMKRSGCWECTGLTPLRWEYEDIAAPYSGGLECGCAETEPDGIMDLTLKFSHADCVDRLRLSEETGQTIPLTVKAFLHREHEAVPIRGEDCLEIK